MDRTAQLLCQIEGTVQQFQAVEKNKQQIQKQDHPKLDDEIQYDKTAYDSTGKNG